MVRTVMSSRNKQLEGIEQFAYLVSHFNMTPDEALATMKEHGQDTGDTLMMKELLNKYNETERK